MVRHSFLNTSVEVLSSPSKLTQKTDTDLARLGASLKGVNVGSGDEKLEGSSTSSVVVSQINPSAGAILHFVFGVGGYCRTSEIHLPLYSTLAEVSHDPGSRLSVSR